MKEQVLASRLRMPRMNDNLIGREQILNIIYNSKEPVVILHAGAGYGKTTTMVKYVQTFRLSCEWYQIERADNDIQRFLLSFETLIQSKVKQYRFHEEPEEWSRETVELIAESILEQMEACEVEWNFILDDFQYIQNPLIYFFLRFFIQYMEHQVRIFFLIRGNFPDFLTKFVLQGWAVVVGEKDLEITREELELYVQEGKRASVDREGIERILRYTEGWAVAVNDALMQQREGIEGEEKEKTYFDMSWLSGYLFYEIINPLTVQQQIFMAESAVLIHIVPEACDYILNMKDTRNFLDCFVQQQLLTKKRNQNEYHYHPALSSFLSGRVAEERKRDIWNRAVEYYLEIQDYDQVFHYQNLLNHKVTKIKKTKKNNTEDKSFALICFGDFLITRDSGSSVLRWRTRKTKEMFVYFWEQQGRYISKEEIIEALWQDGNGQKLEALFHTTLSYLKKIFMEMGMPELIQTENKRYRMQCQNFYSDSQKLQQLYMDWNQDSKEIDVEKGFFLLNQLYQGEYMKDIDGSWILSSRERYRKLYLKCCELLVTKAVSMCKYELAVQILNRAVEWDPYSEYLNGMLLKNLGEMGEYQMAKRQYEKYKQLLREDLDVDIGRQVQEIYQNAILRRIS